MSSSVPPISRQSAWRLKNPDKYRAHLAVEKALRRGTLEKQPCEVCGTTKHIDGHHPNYQRPLEVQWLCRCHHVRLHKQGVSASLKTFIQNSSVSKNLL